MHHVQFRSQRPDLRDDPLNRAPACRACHDRIHSQEFEVWREGDVWEIRDRLGETRGRVPAIYYDSAPMGETLGDVEGWAARLSYDVLKQAAASILELTTDASLRTCVMADEYRKRWACQTRHWAKATGQQLNLDASTIRQYARLWERLGQNIKEYPAYARLGVYALGKIAIRPTAEDRAKALETAYDEVMRGIPARYVSVVRPPPCEEHTPITICAVCGRRLDKEEE